jgi:hypothetical protein
MALRVLIQLLIPNLAFAAAELPKPAAKFPSRSTPDRVLQPLSQAAFPYRSGRVPGDSRIRHARPISCGTFTSGVISVSHFGSHPVEGF